MKFKVGDRVKYGSGNGGSRGTVIEVQLVQARNSPWYTVRWIYGKDVHGEAMTATSRNLESSELEPISDEEYDSIANRDGWGSK